MCRLLCIVYVFNVIKPSWLRPQSNEGNKMYEVSSKVSKKLKKFIVTEVREKKNGFINPVLVTFQNGELSEECASEFDVIFTANENGQTNVEVKTSYGQVFKESNYSGSDCPKQLLAIRNRKTNKVKLVQVDSTLLINSTLLTPVITETTTDYVKELKALNKKFGGKKIVNRLEQRDKLNISSLPVGDEVKKTLNDMKMEENTSAEDIESESIINLLPPCHRDAKVLSEVYLLNEIISDKELEVLINQVNALDENKFTFQEYSQFFVHYYKEAKKSKGNLDTRLAGIFYAECLIKFLNIPSRKLALKSTVLCSFSPALHQKFLNEFCIKTETSVTRPLRMKDKTLCYIIVLSLICCNYEINLKLLSTSTLMNLTRLTRLARTVGAVPFKKDDGVFVLKLPLPALPKSAIGKGRKK